MRDHSAHILLFIALGFVALIFWRWSRFIASQTGPAAVPPAPPGAPAGAGAIPLGQFAVAPSRQWLLIPPGQ